MSTTRHLSHTEEHWKYIMNEVAQRKQMQIRFDHDALLRLLSEYIESDLSSYRFTLEWEFEEDDSYTGSLNELDLVENAMDLDALKQKLALQLIEYADDYVKDIDRYGNAPNRSPHFPYVLHVLIQRDLKGVIDCIDAEGKAVALQLSPSHS